uniref:CUB_2 domain-containing protein n=1 Tax=Caenorhabditis tropicalis TaxID=1561998 RepID=A0A1I7T109_9PELO
MRKIQTDCAGSQTINPPTNISIPWFYPTTWNYTQTDTPQYAPSQNCSWIINIPKGMYAIFTFSANTNNETALRITDSTGYTTIIESSVPFFLLDPSFRVDLQATKNGSLGMGVTWYNVRQTASTTEQIHSNGSPLIAYSTEFDNPTVIQSDTKVSLLALPPTLIITDATELLRNTQIFDGPDINSTHVGNLYQILISGKSFVSSGKYLTIYSLFPGYGTLGNSVILQDYFNVKDFKSYKAINCISLITTCEFDIDASDGTAVAIRYTPSYFFIKDVSMPQTNVLSVYTDFVTPAHKLADYTSTTSKTDVPQKINGVFTSFLLNKDKAKVIMSSNAENAGWTSGFNGRRGFFYSPNYSFNSSSQDFSEKIQTSSSISNISYTIERAAIQGSATLNVIISKNQKSVIDTTYSVTNFPSGPVSAEGDQISVTYKSNGAWTTGSFVSFQIDKSATANGILIAVLISLWNLFSI